MRLTRTRQKRHDRVGATIVETAVVLPIFFTLIFAFVEFGHCFMTIHTMNSAARRAARLAVSETATTQNVIDTARDILGSAIDADHENIQIWVKDASIFDDIAVDASTVDYENLPNVLVEDLAPRALFVVRVQVPYSEIGILGPRWVADLNLYGQSVMRKE